MSPEIAPEEPTAPAEPEGEASDSLSPPPETNPPLAIMTKPWFWVLLVGSFWSMPLFKSLGAEYPDPPPGFERTPESREFALTDGRTVSLAELKNQLLVVCTLDLSSSETSDKSFEEFRIRRSRLRGLASMVVYLVLVRGGESVELDRLIEEKTARRPNNLFVMDLEGEELLYFRQAADDPRSSVFLLDRHARLRGHYRSGSSEADRLARESGILANWVGADPEPGEAVER